MRWYSPRDWIEDEDCTDEEEKNDKVEFSPGQESQPKKKRRKIKGHLSNRMKIPGNLWQEVIYCSNLHVKAIIKSECFFYIPIN